MIPISFLGTPDYLAPELLLRKPHSAAVDWWGLGVCLYEFVTGVPPFSDDTPEKVFDNILALRLEWPSESDGDLPLSENVVEAIMSLLTLDPDQRADIEGLRKLPFFLQESGGKYLKDCFDIDILRQVRLSIEIESQIIK